jgi:hypothetical protein
MAGGTVTFGVPREVAFDYLVEPRNRPQWQSSLARVEQVTGEPRTGQTWVDVTRLRIRPQMRTTGFDRPTEWSESGVWRGVAADLTLHFDATVRGCRVRYRFRIQALGPLGLLATVLAGPAVRADLRRAARILSSGSG